MLSANDKNDPERIHEILLDSEILSHMFLRYQNFIRSNQNYGLLKFIKEDNRIPFVYFVESNGKIFIGSHLTEFGFGTDELKRSITICSFNDPKLDEMLINDHEIHIIKRFKTYQDAIIFESFLHYLFSVSSNSIIVNSIRSSLGIFKNISIPDEEKIVLVNKNFEIVASFKYKDSPVYIDNIRLNYLRRNYFIDINGEKCKALRYTDYLRLKETDYSPEKYIEPSPDYIFRDRIVKLTKDGIYLETYNNISELKYTSEFSENQLLDPRDLPVGNCLYIPEEEYLLTRNVKELLRNRTLSENDPKRYINIKKFDSALNEVTSYETMFEITYNHEIIEEIIRGIETGEPINSEYWTAEILPDSSTSLKKELENEAKLRKAYVYKFGSLNRYFISKKILNLAPKFKINENIHEKFNLWNDNVHFIMRWQTGIHIEFAFESMKVDLNDPNVSTDLSSGNIGTPQRIAKMWCGSDIHDDRELMGGRFHVPVRLARFPNEMKRRIPIIKEVDLLAVCSHHAAPFGTLVSTNQKSKVVIAYIPNEYVLGISKLQRLVRYISQRGWLQEDLTVEIYNLISEAAQTESVYVKLKNIEHSCEKYRGALTQGDGFTTEYFGGEFDPSNSPESAQLLDMVRQY